VSLSERELDEIIIIHLSKELASEIEIPNIDDQWQKIKNRINVEDDILKIPKTVINRKRITMVATVLILVSSINFLYPHNADAVGKSIAKFFSYVVGKTTRNMTETYHQVDEPPMPKIQDLGDLVDEEVTLDQAKTATHFKLAIPSYLPPGANIRRVILTSVGVRVYQVSIEYNLNDKVFVFRQQDNAKGTSRGTLYDTDDTSVKDLIVNGSPAIMYLSKNGLNTLNWQVRNLLLQITGVITEEEITKMANSIN